jgi:hypothetical protein
MLKATATKVNETLDAEALQLLLEAYGCQSINAGRKGRLSSLVNKTVIFITIYLY